MHSLTRETYQSRGILIKAVVCSWWWFTKVVSDFDRGGDDRRFRGFKQNLRGGDREPSLHHSDLCYLNTFTKIN